MDKATDGIRKLVKEKGIPVSVIARRTGFTPGALYPSFNGMRTLKPDEFLAICKFLDVDPLRFSEDSAGKDITT